MVVADARNDTSPGREVWVAGLGLVSSLGEGVGAHWQQLACGAASAVVDTKRFAPYSVHPLAAIDFARQIPNKADVRQMGPWQSLGTYAAGLALTDAGLVDRDARAEVHLSVAAGNGERDAAADGSVLAALSATAGIGQSGPVLNEALLRALRPTLYLVELSNLLAGNISIVHGVTASSRTFKGEEMAGVAAVEDAVKRIAAGTGELFLVGGACNAERADLLLNLELCNGLAQRGNRSVWERADEGGGMILGSVGAFLVLESACHARARGRRPYARIVAAASERAGRPHDLEHLRPRRGPHVVLSGASGAEPATHTERTWLDGLGSSDTRPVVRGFGTVFGHALDAQFPLGLALSAMALSKQQLFSPFDSSGFELPHDGPLDGILVTSFGHWRGAGMAFLEAVPSVG
ncbi:MAG: beta-ketoacyl-ACP synthase [Hyphomicrobiaceae bacterium]